MKSRSILVALLAAVLVGAFPRNARAERGGAAGASRPERVRDAQPSPIPLRATAGGTLTFPGGNLALAAYFTGWSSVPVSADWEAAEEDAATFVVNAGRPVALRGRDGKTALRGRSSWTAGPDGTVVGYVWLECIAPVTLQCVALCASIPAEPASGLGDGVSSTYDIPIDGGRSLRIAFDKPQPWHAQDSRPWGGRWSVRFGDTMRARDFSPGDTVEWRVTVSSPDGRPLAFSLGHPVTIAEGDAWARLDYKKDIAAGSALDFSGMGFQDAPAGRHGWLKSVGGRFEFERLPGVGQRFYGINLCFRAQYLTHEDADMLVERFVRSGYNAVRIHHHDGMWFESGENREKLDYLLARLFEHGIYATTDLYVSRDVKWRDVGIDRDGDMPKALYKTYVGLHEPSFRDWCEHARAFLEHVNPYTGRAYKDEPALPLISLVNEGRLATGWGECKKAEDPLIREAWREYQKELSTSVHKSSMSTNANEKLDFRLMDNGEQLELVNKPIPPDPDLNSPDSAFNRFDAWVNRRVFEKGSAFLRSLGCKALLTNDNSGRWHGEGESCTALYDYVDSHFYIDHPAFIDQLWRLPARCENTNPIMAGKPPIFHRGYAKDASRPYVISEWNFSGPGRYRGMGGLLTGALAAEQDWDGLWRFTYSHESRNLKDVPVAAPGFFDSATDPLAAAAERAGVCLFLRGDALGVAPGAPAPGRANLRETPLSLDPARGSMTIVSPCLCGGFAESGRIDAGPLSFEIGRGGTAAPAEVKATAENEGASCAPFSSGGGAERRLPCGGRIAPPAPATLWVASLDGEPIERSSRMLLTHLTDVQGDGARYADEARQVLLKWGKGCLVECGEADVELRLENPAAPGDAQNHAGGSFRVWALSTAGERAGEIPAVLEPDSGGERCDTARTGTLRFRVSTRQPFGGCLHYEIIRE